MLIMSPTLLRPVKRGFVPTDISGLALWADADAITGLSNADPVTTWEDQSGNGNDLAQSTSAAKPTYRTNVVNGKPVVRFDGTDDTMVTAAFASELAQPNTIIAVALFATTATTNRMICDGLAAGKRHAMYSHLNSGGKWTFYAGTTEVNGSVIATGAFHVVSAIYNGASSVLYLNGAQDATGNTGSNPLSGLRLGSFAGAAFLNGDIAEILVYDSALSTADRESVEEYLMEKYAL